jgi:Zn-dependent peptidase ImmA (M78 family)/DNA-binding XRE family transcriptional regulator
MSVGGRVRQMREMHRLTQATLAREIPGLTQSRLSRIESDLAELDDMTGELLAVELSVKSEFFLRNPITNLVAQSPQLRARNRLSQTAKTAVFRWAQIILEEFERLESVAKAIPLRLENLEGWQPQEAAQRVRRSLGFDDSSPLPYLVLALERVGITVIGIPHVEPQMDAFCAWEGTRPVVGILHGPPGDRVRWSVAHELGHLVLHRDVKKSATLEEEADAFAAELLIPISSLRNEMPRVLKLSHLTALKSQWGASIKSLIRRARELGVIDQDRALSLYKQMSARGWNRSEPGYVPLEKPRAFRKLAEISFSSTIRIDAMAADAAWSEPLARKVLDRHASAEELPYERDYSHPSGKNVVDLASMRRRQAAAASKSEQLRL